MELLYLWETIPLPDNIGYQKVQCQANITYFFKLLKSGMTRPPRHNRLFIVSVLLLKIPHI